MLGHSHPYVPPTALLDELHSIRQHNIALIHYLHRTLRIVMKELQCPSQLTLTFQSHYFSRLLLANHLCKIDTLQSIIRKNALRRMLTIKLKRQRCNQAITHAGISLKQIVFRQWQKEWEVGVKLRILLKMKRIAEWRIFTEIVKCKMRNRMSMGVSSLLASLHRNYLLKLCFFGLVCELKVEKILKIRRKVIGRVWCGIKELNDRDRMLVQSFRNHSLARRSMGGWKQGLSINRSETVRRATLLRGHFDNWVRFMAIEGHERSIDNANEIILQDYSERKLRGHLLRVFLEWRHYAETTLHSKQENTAVRQYAKLKQRDCLMRGAFAKLLLNVAVCKMDRFRSGKLKAKVLEILKAVLVKESLLLERVVAYVKSKEVGRYFKAIREFNAEEKEKVQAFLLKKAFDWLSVRLATEYYVKVTRAQEYHSRSLRLKVLLGLRELRLHRGREKWLINKLNVINPLRMWRRVWRLQKYQQGKNWALKKQVIREWKIANIRYQ